MFVNLFERLTEYTSPFPERREDADHAKVQPFINRFTSMLRGALVYAALAPAASSTMTDTVIAAEAQATPAKVSILVEKNGKALMIRVDGEDCVVYDKPDEEHFQLRLRHGRNGVYRDETGNLVIVRDRQVLPIEMVPKEDHPRATTVANSPLDGRPKTQKTKAAPVVQQPQMPVAAFTPPPVLHNEGLAGQLIKPGDSVEQFVHEKQLKHDSPFHKEWTIDPINLVPNGTAYRGRTAEPAADWILSPVDIEYNFRPEVLRGLRGEYTIYFVVPMPVSYGDIVVHHTEVTVSAGREVADKNKHLTLVTTVDPSSPTNVLLTGSVRGFKSANEAVYVGVSLRSWTSLPRNLPVEDPSQPVPYLAVREDLPATEEFVGKRPYVPVFIGNSCALPPSLEAVFDLNGKPPIEGYAVMEQHNRRMPLTMSYLYVMHPASPTGRGENVTFAAENFTHPKTMERHLQAVKERRQINSGEQIPVVAQKDEMQ